MILCCNTVPNGNNSHFVVLAVTKVVNSEPQNNTCFHASSSACYFHAASFAASVSERDSLVDESLSVQPNGYFHATYSAGSVCAG